MTADPDFRTQPKMFWAYVRTLSQRLGYTERARGTVKVPRVAEMSVALGELGLDPTRLVRGNAPSPLGRALGKYFQYRAEVLNKYVRERLMDAAAAEALFSEVNARLGGIAPTPMNKQKGEKARPAYFTGIVNMLVAESLDGAPCDYSPMQLTTVTRDGEVVRTLSRRLDGAFPATLNPVAVWEIKEYYYTTTFGSRIADGVYETLLDGMELEDLREHEGVTVGHYLMVDAYDAWWRMGRSYLCRIIDMLNMGYVDEVLFGREVVERIPLIASAWLNQKRTAKSQSSGR